MPAVESQRGTSPAEIKRAARAAELHKLEDSQDPGEPDPIPEVVEEPVVEAVPEPEPEPVLEEPAAEAEPDPVAEPEGKRKRGPDVWAAIKASEARFAGAMTEAEKRQEERFNKLLDRLAPQPQAAPAPTVEQDPEVEAWNSAVMGTVTPEIQALKTQLFLQRVDSSVEIASQKHSDFEELVGDIHNPDTELAKYLIANPTEQSQVFTARNIGEALYQKAKFLKESTPEARETWRDAERKRIRDEERAELMKEFKGVIAKGTGKSPVKPDSIVSIPHGSGAPANGPLDAARIRAIAKSPDGKKQLEALIARGEAGEDIE